MANAWLGLVWFALMLLGNGFFVAAEFSLISARRAKIEPLAEAGSKPARITLRAMERVPTMLATSQIGVTVFSLAILLIAEPSLHVLLNPAFTSIGLDGAAANALTLIIALIVVATLHVIVGELVPKQITFVIPERIALVLVPVLYGLAMILRPIVWAMNAVANLVLRLFGVIPKDAANTAFTLDQVEDIVEHSTREGVLSDTSGAISNTFEFTEKSVDDIVVPLSMLVSLPETVTPNQVEAAVRNSGFSRYPLVDLNGQLSGYLHIKDVLDLDDDEYDLPFPAKRVRDLISFASTTELEDALASMRRGGHHLGRVLDLAGNTVGIVFLEDILEELVGEVQDATRRI